MSNYRLIYLAYYFAFQICGFCFCPKTQKETSSGPELSVLSEVVTDFEVYFEISKVLHSSMSPSPRISIHDRLTLKNLQ